MPRVIRIRENLSIDNEGKIIPSTGPEAKLRTTRKSQCIDYRGSPVRPSAFNSTQYRGLLVMTGQVEHAKWSGSSTGKTNYNKWATSRPTAESTLATLPAPSGWHLDLVAGTNPSRPVFMPHMIVQDLLHLPRMVREVGNFLRNPSASANLRGIADWHLAIRFGWLNLYQDLQKMLDFQNLAQKRIKELNQLYSKEGLRRRLKFGSDKSVASQTFRVPLEGPYYFDGNISTLVEKRSWGTIRWAPTTPPPYQPGDDSQIKLVRRLIFGLTPEGLGKGGWEVIPWTWLLGWFTNVGKYIQQYSNTVPASHYGACFMSEASATSVFQGWSNGPGVVNNNVRVPGKQSLVLKSRIVATGAPTVGFSMPFLDIHKLSILGSLAIQRIIRR